MLNKYHILFLLCVLPGCGNSLNNNGYGYSYDDQNNGLRVRYAEGFTTPTAADLYKMFVNAERCADVNAERCADNVAPGRANISVNPPLVVMVPPGTNDPYDGLTYYATGTITIETQWVGDRWLWVHEFERWISFSRGVPVEKIDSAPELDCAWII